MPSPSASSSPKVFQLIRILPSSEDREIIEFLTSPQGSEGHAAAPRLVLLYQMVRKHTPADAEDYGTADENIRRAIWRKLWQGKAEKTFDVSYRRLLSDLMAALERYLVWRQMQRSPLLWSVALGTAMLEVNPSEGLAGLLFNQLAASLEAVPQSVDDKWYDLRLKEIALMLEARRWPRQRSAELENLGQSFGQFALARALKYYCTLRSHQIALGKGNIPSLVTAMRRLAAEHRDELDALGQLYLHAADLQDANALTPDQIRTFVRMLGDTTSGVDGAELMGLFRFAISSAAIAERSDRSFAGMLSEIYSVLMAHPLAAAPALQSPIMMSQFLRISLKARGPGSDLQQMAVQFQEFLDRLPATYRESYGQFLEALLQYHLGHFQTAFDQLGKVATATRDPFVRLSSLKYKVRILFDAEEVLLVETDSASRPGRKTSQVSSYASVDTMLERYRKASDYGGGLASEIMAYHQQFYRHLRELNHLTFGDPHESGAHTQTLQRMMADTPETEDYQWLRAKLD